MQIRSKTAVGGNRWGCIGTAVMVLLLTGCRSPQPTHGPFVSLQAEKNTDQEQAPPWYFYDCWIADCVSARWHQLMDLRSVAEDKGRVVLDFTLLPDGTIGDLAILENTEGIILAALCQKAVLDPAPYTRQGRNSGWQEGPRTFRIRFEFNAAGEGYVTYQETPTELLARGSRKTTLIVLTYHPAKAHTIRPS